MVARNQERAHGQTAAEDVVKDAKKDAWEPVKPEPEKPLNLTRAFARMRTDWNSPDRDTVQAVKRQVDEIIFDRFSDVYAILFDLYEIVRIVKVDANGEIKMDAFGLPEYEKRPDGFYVEDWDKLTRKDRDRFQYMIITRMVRWEQDAADIWGEALLSKAVWEEAFATGFESIAGDKPTVSDRENRGRRLSADHRYLAVYKSYLSRRADTLVSSMKNISQRLKDMSTV